MSRQRVNPARDDASNPPAAGPARLGDNRLIVAIPYQIFAVLQAASYDMSSTAASHRSAFATN
jgi:hypothetical protein